MNRRTWSVGIVEFACWNEYWQVFRSALIATLLTAPSRVDELTIGPYLPDLPVRERAAHGSTRRITACSYANGLLVPRNCNLIGVPGSENISLKLLTRYR